MPSAVLPVLLAPPHISRAVFSMQQVAQPAVVLLPASRGGQGLLRRGAHQSRCLPAGLACHGSEAQEVCYQAPHLNNSMAYGVQVAKQTLGKWLVTCSRHK